MSTVWRWFSRLVLVLLSLLAALAAVWTYGRLSSPTEAQRQAMALMEARGPVPEGENGFDLLMALPPAPAKDAPALPACEDDASCIAVIEAAPEQSSAAIGAWRPVLEASARALRAPAFRDLRTEASVAEALPPFHGLIQLPVLRAFDFATGQSTAALDAACRDAQAAVGRATAPDVLIDGMLATVLFRRYAGLIADMRGRAPHDPLPASCAALAVVPDPAVEGSICEAMRGEWQWAGRVMQALGNETPSGVPSWASPLLHDPQWLLARLAERYAPVCAPAAAAALRQDRAVAFAEVESRWVDAVAFPVSRVLDTIAAPAYVPYAERQLDFVAQRRLLAAFLQMEAMDASLEDASRFDALPAALREGPRPLRFDPVHRTLSVPLRGHDGGAQDGEASIALPVRAASPVPPPAEAGAR